MILLNNVAYANDTEVTLSGGILTITDINGGSSNDNLEISYSGSTYTIADSNGLTFSTSISGASGNGSSSISVPDTNVTGINFNLLAGDDNITVTSVQSSFSNNFTVTSGTGNDTITIDADIATTNSGAISITVSNYIVLNSGSSLTTVNGGITLVANNGGTATGNETGISTANNSQITTTGTGDIHLTGYGLNDSSTGGHAGIQNFGTISSTASGANAGTITLIGYGGTGTNLNDGVQVRNNITSVDGNISITGSVLGSVSSFLNFGVKVQSATVSSTGTGANAATITINGTGGAGSSDNSGVRIESTSGIVTSVVGNISITGSGGSGSNSPGVQLLNGQIISTGTGSNAATITIIGTGTSNSNRGVELDDNANESNAEIATVDGNITITATATTNNANAMQFSSDADGIVSTGSATLSITGTPSGSGNAIRQNAGTIGGASATGAITLIGDTFNLTGGSIQSSNTLTIEPLTTGTSIGLGDNATGTLNLNTSELALLADGFSSITVGKTNSTGAVDINSVTFNDPTTIYGNPIESEGSHSNVTLTDTVAPSTTSFTRQTPTEETTNSDSLIFLATFSETVSNVSSNDFSVSGTSASVTNVSGSGNTYSITVSGGDLASYTGTVGLNFVSSPTINDTSNSLPNTEPSTDETYTLDNTAPTVTTNIVDASLNNTDNNSNVTFTFSENVTGFTQSDLTVSGGTLSGFSFSDGSSTGSATFTASDNSSTTGSITVNANSYTDSVGNTGASHTDTVTVDTANPTITVNIVETSLNDTTNSSNVTFTFSENVTGFTQSDLTVSGGTLSSFSFSDGSSTGSATFTASDNSTTTGSITVNANSYADSGGNTGTSSNDTVTVDTTNPTITVNIVETSLNDTTNSSNVSFTFSENVTGFIQSDLTVSGGTLSNFSFSDGNSTGSATFTANDNSTTTGSITVNADSYTDSVGNTGTSGSDNVTVDTANPTLSDANISISGASGTGGAFKIGDTVTATWDNTANGDNNSDIASVSVDFSAFGSSTTVTANNTANTWTATYTIVAGTINSTNLNISVTATDSSDNTTTTVDTSNATVDNQAPTVSVTIVDSSLNDSDNQSSVTFAFSENITGFTESDLTVVGGTISDFSFSDSSNTASATFTANDSSNTNGSVTVNTDSYTDLVGNTGTNGTDTVTVDTTNPTVTVDITDTSLNNTDKSSNVTFTFSENITGFIEADLTIAGGTISNFSFSDNSNSGTATFTADDNTTTTGSITVNADSYTNLVGNTGTSGSDTIAIDTVNPSLTSFTRKTPPDESTNADTLTFLATFSEDVTGVDNADFTANGVTGSTINVTQVTASTYDIQLSGGDLASFNGTVSLDLNSPSITDLANNALPTNEPSTDESYTVSNYTLSIATTTHGSENGSSTPTHIVFTITTSPSNASGSAITGSIAYTGTAMSGTDYTAGVNSFSIADGASSTTVTLTVTEDYSVEGTETVIATIANPSRGSITNEAATATIADDDSANLALSKTTVTVNESGTTDTFTIALTSQPSSDVIIDLSNNDTEEASINPTQVTFSNSNWNTPQTVTVMGLNDNEQDGNQTLDLTIAIDTSNSDNTYSNLASQTVTITVEDDDIDGAEIDVQGGITPMTIADGDTSPHTVDDTDFGASTITKTFTIHNLGSADLTLTGAATVTLVNQNDSAFEITQTPNSSTLAIGTSATFAITFTPPASGISIATVVIESNDSNESLYSFNIQGRASQTLTPPRIEKLRAYLNDDADKNVLQRFQNVGGSIRFAFDLIDSDDGSYVYEWSSSNTDFNTLLSALSVSSSNGVITSSVVDISNLVAGIYPMTIRVSDSTFTSDPSYKAQANYLLTIVNEAVTNDDNSRDNDNDGIVNAHDSNPNEANHIPARLSSGNHYLAQVETGYRLLLGDTTKAAQRTGIKISQTDLASYGHEGHSANNTALSNQTLNHIFDYVIEGIPILDTQAGTSVRVVLPLETPLQSNSTFHKYNPTSGWSTVTGLEWADWDGGQAGICPNPDSTAYNNTTSQTGKTCLRMTLQDGGTYDQDGLVNGRIVDPLGIATPTPTSSGGGSSSSSSSCLLEGTPTHVSQINENPQECSDGGYKTHYFFLALDNPLDVDASVTYSTLDGTATAGEDYVAVSGTATIPAGAQYAAIPVQLIRDNVAEPDETFALVIQNPMGGTFPMDSNEILATHVIRDDDRSGSAYLEAQPSQSHHVITRPLEGNQNYTHYFLLELNQVLAQTAQLNYRTESGTAIADQDFIAAEGIITIPAGETHAIIGVTLIGDQGAEDDETFSVVITDPEGANFPDSMTEIRSTHTIVDDD